MRKAPLGCCGVGVVVSISLWQAEIKVLIPVAVHYYPTEYMSHRIYLEYSESRLSFVAAHVTV